MPISNSSVYVIKDTIIFLIKLTPEGKFEMFFFFFVSSFYFVHIIQNPIRISNHLAWGDGGAHL